ncbi:MAG: hypothetical protein WD066_12040 [Planctomycetaceae bacterium]
MHLAFACPACASPRRTVLSSRGTEIACPCGWRRAVDPDVVSGSLGRNSSSASRAAMVDPGASTQESPAECLVCGCDDLWRQKDFPQGLGLAIVGLGMLLSTIAWAYYRPVTAIGILMAFAVADLVLYARMSDVLVCYRCQARHRHREIAAAHPAFDLETAERYRQEQLRLEKSR